MKIFLAALLFIGIGVLGMCFNILFRKKDFPEFEVSSNKEMRRLGIRCMKEEEDELWGDEAARGKKHGCSGNYGDSCAGCAFYKKS